MIERLEEVEGHYESILGFKTRKSFPAFYREKDSSTDTWTYERDVSGKKKVSETKSRGKQLQKITAALTNVDTITDDQLKDLIAEVGAEAGSVAKPVGAWNVPFGGRADRDGFL